MAEGLPRMPRALGPGRKQSSLHKGVGHGLKMSGTVGQCDLKHTAKLKGGL